MTEISRDNFYAKLETAPYAVRGFFETIIQHFQRGNMVKPHHTDTKGGDLRLAIPGAVLGQKMRRNFATMYWQSTKQAVFSRTYLTPDELAVLGFDGALKPKDKGESLMSDVRLGEDVWRYGAQEFIRALEMAKVKFLNEKLQR